MIRAPRFALLAGLSALTVAIAPLTASAGDAREAGPFAFRFSYDRADVENPDTAVEVYEALARKVDRACRDDGIGLIEQRTAASRACAREALDRAIAQIDAGALSALHAQRLS